MHLLVLDLDETLLHSVLRSPSLSSPGVESERAFGGARVLAHGAFVTGYRPGLAGFLRALGARYRLAVWSAGGAAYVAGALAGLRALSGVEPEFEFVFSRERCTPRVGEDGTLVPEKNLEKVFRRGWRREHVLVPDDRPEGLRRHHADLFERTHGMAPPTTTSSSSSCPSSSGSRESRTSARCARCAGTSNPCRSRYRHEREGHLWLGSVAY